ncbi:MAG: hypothetical protein B6245_16905 [Desulfobacteraceae bacterium 4572_88]|nr:MAG: hypothetical protein B6245_16905 [Desulfobacteraceae bacterium 4572_88]
MKKTIFLTVFISIMLIGNLRAFEIPKIDIHGFVSQGFLKTDQNNYLGDTEDGTFQFNEMGINFSTKLPKRLRIGLQFFSRDLGQEGNNDIVLDWAYADYRWKEWLGFRIGKIKVVYGLYNETRDMDMLRASVMLPQSVYTELWRDALSSISGGSLYGDLPLGVMGHLSYDFQIGALSFDEDGGFAKAFEISLSDYALNVTDMDSDHCYMAGITWHTPLEGLKTKVSYYKIENLRVDGNLTIPAESGAIGSHMNYEVYDQDGYVVSLEYIWEDMALAAEYTEVDFKGRWDWNLGQGWQLRPELPSLGWYLSAAYAFTDWFTLGASYSEFYPNANDKDGKTMENDFEAWLKTVTLSTRFDVNDYWILKLEGSYNDGFGAYSPAENPEGLDQRWFLLTAKVTFNF